MKTDNAEETTNIAGFTMDTAGAVIAGYESSVARLILCCLTELPKQFGQQKICDTLRGSNATFIIDHKLHELKTYGALSPFTRTQLYLIVDLLIEQGLIAAEEIINKTFGFRVLALTEKGKRFMASDEVVAFGFNQLLFTPVIAKLTEKDFELFAQLRRITRRIAGSLGVPCFAVLAPRPMLEMALEKPSTEEHLLTIYGIRKDFVEKFGNDYIPSIKKFVDASVQAVA